MDNKSEDPKHRDEYAETDDYGHCEQPQHQSDWAQVLDLVLGEDRTKVTYVKSAIGMALGVLAFILVLYSMFADTGKCSRLGCFW